MTVNQIEARLLLAAAAPKEIPAFFQPAPVLGPPNKPTGYEKVEKQRQEMKLFAKGGREATSQVNVMQYQMAHEDARRKYVGQANDVMDTSGLSLEKLETQWRAYEAALDVWEQEYQVQRSAKWALHWADQVLAYATE